MGRTPFSKQNEEKSNMGMGLKKGPWSAEEDQKLIAYIRRYGIWNWTHMPKAAGLARSGKSCRLRWLNYLRPNIKHGHFSEEEVEAIVKWHQLLGNSWSAIATKLPGRTDNEIKNYWNTRLKKRMPSEESVQTPPKSHPRSRGVASPPPDTKSIKINQPNILESFSQDVMSGSSAGSPEALEFEETSKSPLPVDWINNEVGNSNYAGRSPLADAIRGLELDFWERMVLPPLEELSMEMDFEAMIMVSSGFGIPSINYQPESSTDGYLVYDYLWTD